MTMYRLAHKTAPGSSRGTAAGRARDSRSFFDYKISDYKVVTTEIKDLFSSKGKEQKPGGKNFIQERLEKMKGSERLQYDRLARETPDRGFVHGLLSGKRKTVAERIDMHFARKEVTALDERRRTVAALDPFEMRMDFIDAVAGNMSSENEMKIKTLFHARCPKLNTVTREDLMIALTRVINSSKLDDDGKHEALESLMMEVRGVKGCLPGTLNHH